MRSPRLIWEDRGEDQPFAPLLHRQKLMRQTWERSTGSKRIHVLTCSHRPTVTFGYRCAVEAQLVVPRSELEQRGVDLVVCERGGLATFHGPGQLMIYPMLSLPAWGVGVRRYIDLLQEATVRTLAEWGCEARAGAAEAPGVWHNGHKIAQIGVHVSRGIPIQGLCLNLFGDLSPFSWIYACGERNPKVIHLERVARERPDRLKIAERWMNHFWGLLQENPQVLPSFAN